MKRSFFKKLTNGDKIPKKRSQAEDTGARKLLNESLWIKAAVIIFFGVLTASVLSGAVYGKFSAAGPLIDLLVFSLAVFTVQVILQIYFYQFEKELYFSNKRQLLVEVVIVLSVLLQSALVMLPVFSSMPYAQYIYTAPAGIMMLTLFFGIRTSFLLSFVIGLYSGLIRGMVPEAFVIAPVACAFSALMIKDVRSRSQITKAGIYLMAITLFLDLLAFLVSGRFDINALQNYGMGAVFTGGVCILLLLTLPHLFEHIFKEVTDIKLLELSDMNHPLLRELVMKAPGTYHHSITVANIAEAAAEAIGARSLLVRVMAYYHDIGKIVKTEYFSENQMGARSPHEKLSATMSSLIIVSHVKNGVDYAVRYKLPKAVIDGILEHHGTSLVYFFFKRALDEAGEKEEVKEENFRYPGPKPQSRETGILSVADTIEAASRSLADPSPSRIKGLVGELLSDKYVSGELDECKLMFSELNVIKDVIIRMLTARFHTRPVYPDKKNE